MYELIAAAAPILAGQHSLITSTQACGAGGSHDQLRRLVGGGIWERLERGLYGPVGVPMYWSRRLMAAILMAPGGSIVSHRAGAAMLRVGGPHEPEPEITIPCGQSFRRKGVIVHESVDLDMARRITIDGVPVTGPARLAVDLGSVISPARYTQTMREIRFGLKVSKETLLRSYLQHKQRGRNGCGALRDWLDRHFSVEGVAESALEQVAFDEIVDAGLPVPVLQLWVETPSGRYRLDIAYPLLKVAVEVNGRQHKEDADVVENDVVRAAALKALGWRILVIDSDSFASDLAAVIRELRRLHGSAI